MQHSATNGYISWQLSRWTTEIAGLPTAFYGVKKPDPKKPNVLLVHGIGGDHHGMMPLGWELRHHYNVYFVELPGHGASALPVDRSLAYWNQWAHDLGRACADRQIVVDEVVGHSFGCLAVGAMDSLAARRYTMLSPVPKPTLTYGTYARVISALRYAIGPWYGRYLFALWRGLILLHVRTSQSVAAVRWISRQTRCSQTQLYYHMSLAKQMSAHTLFAIAPVVREHLRVFMGSHDTLSAMNYFELSRELPDVTVRLLVGGHLLPIESPAEVAREIAA